MRSDLNLHALEQFVALARTRNFTRTAEELHVSQPALSRSIRKLEEQLGSPLFERRPREVVLTDLGERLLERAREILRMIDETLTELSDAGRHPRIRLGAIPTIAPYFLPRILGGFSEVRPEVRVVVQEDTTDQLVRRCSQGELDVVILALPLAAPALQVEPLFEEELLLVMPAQHSLAASRTVSINALERFPFVTLNEVHCLSENIASFCRRKSVQPVSMERTSQLVTVQELVSLDHGLSIVPEMAREIDTSETRVYRSFTGDRPQRTVALGWNPQRPVGEAVQAFMKHVKEQSGRKAGSRPPESPAPRNPSRSKSRTG
jgi:LysR family hydrogen peroxide-inducible transcriptional activator